jgi:hypothetical protein
VGATAELIADGGAGAAANEFFRSASFHRAEGISHTLRISSAGRAAALAVAVRPIAGTDRIDAASAYGYPGASVEGAGEPPPAAAVDWSPTGLVSLFVRDRLGEPPFLAAPTERGRVLVHDPARPRMVRRRLGEQIRQARRRGYRTEATRGPDSVAAARGDFHRIYTETMRAASAAERYFFDRGYVDAALDFERSWLIVVRDPAAEAAAAAIAAVSDGYLHYFLGGTADDARADSPFKLAVAAMLDLADDAGLPLNLGGGLAPGDGLERFKRGFANAEAPFHTHEVVCEEAAYADLAAGRADGGFFPAYRAP